MIRKFGATLASLALAATVAFSSGAPALAEQGLALVLGNFNYRQMPRVRGGDELSRIADLLRRNEFEVIEGRDLVALQARRLARDFAERAEHAPRLLVIVAGRIATGPGGSHLLGIEARKPDLFGASAVSLPLEAIESVLAKRPGGAVLLVAAESRGTELGAGLSADYDPGPVPQGVTVAWGSLGDVSETVEAGLLVPGTALARALQAHDLRTAGFLSPTLPFIPAPDEGVDPGEFAYWNAVRDIGTAEAYAAYLRRYPDGVFAAAARVELDALRAGGARTSPPAPAPETRSPDAGESALRLSREDRKDIQRDLTLLGYDTRGIDGIFGAGTRNAIAAWQRARGWPPSGYLDAEQLAALRAEADRARERRRREDDDYWARTGAAGTEEGLRDYLDAFPDGLHAGEARERLNEILAERERRAWEEAEAEDTARAYRRYLDDWPEGEHAEEARDRLDYLERYGYVDRDQRERDRAEEASVAGSGATRLLVEQRLARAGFNPGRVDGNFDRKTRRAIARFQASRGLTPTGYVSRRTFLLLMLPG